MIFLLRTSLSRNLGDLGNPQVTHSVSTSFKLYAGIHVGTKKLIEDYIEEVCKQLNIICDAETPDLSTDAKLQLNLNIRQAFGRTALLFSGGASLGCLHLGVAKCLFQAQLMPQIISGSSIGSMIAALCCTKTDDALRELFSTLDVNLNVLEDERGENIFVKLSRLMRHGTQIVEPLILLGVLFDIQVLKDSLRVNIGDVTFLEAYNRTRRVLCVLLLPLICVGKLYRTLGFSSLQEHRRFVLHQIRNAQTFELSHCAKCGDLECSGCLLFYSFDLQKCTACCSRQIRTHCTLESFRSSMDRWFCGERPADVSIERIIQC